MKIRRDGIPIRFVTLCERIQISKIAAQINSFKAK